MRHSYGSSMGSGTEMDVLDVGDLACLHARARTSCDRKGRHMELRTRLLSLFALLGIASACGEGATTPPVPSSPTALRIDLETPHTDDGAVVVTLRGPDVSNLQAASPRLSRLFAASTAGTSEVRLIVVGDLKGGALATVSIARATSSPTTRRRFSKSRPARLCCVRIFPDIT
jgi:hypothetical protein